MIADQLVRYIDAKLASITAQLKQQVKSEVLIELKAEMQLDKLKAEMLDEISTKLQSLEAKEDECITSPPVPVPETFAPVPPPQTLRPVPPPASNDIRSENDIELTYEVSNSVWDLAWFIGMEEIGRGGSVIASMLWALNVIIQASFCIICHRNFTASAFSEHAMDGLEDFRLANAHDHRFHDKMFGKSLIQNICLQDAVYAQNSMVYGARQLEVLNEVKDYLDLETAGIMSLFSGPYMCMLALVCWTLCVLRELKRIWCCIRALARIPRGPHTVIDRGVLSYLGRSRFIFIFGIELQEVAICSVLLFSGCIWLSRTSDIQELLLNAAALDFVLSIDEMIFEALAPRLAHAFIESMAPLLVVGGTSCKGIDLFTIARTLFLLVILIFSYCNFVRPLVAQMHAAQSALCDHDLEFLYGIDRSHLVWIDRPSAAGTIDRFKTAAQQTVRDIIHRRPNQDTSLAGNLPYAFARSVNDINGIVAASAALYPDHLNAGCDDLVGTGHKASWSPERRTQSRTFLNFLRVYTNNFSISTCKDLRGMGVCSILNHPAITLCSQSCGCRSPRSLVFSHKSTWGCPAACLHHKDYTTALENLRPNCTDSPFADLQASVFWQAWTTQVLKSYSFANARNTVANMTQFGCNFSIKKQFCAGSSFSGMRPLSPICPQSCGCSIANVAHCAPKCGPTVLSPARSP